MSNIYDAFMRIAKMCAFTLLLLIMLTALCLLCEVLEQKKAQRSIKDIERSAAYFRLEAEEAHNRREQMLYDYYRRRLYPVEKDEEL